VLRSIFFCFFLVGERLLFGGRDIIFFLCFVCVRAFYQFYDIKMEVEAVPAASLCWSNIFTSGKCPVIGGTQTKRAAIFVCNY
jgi:hypothetical protein